MATLSLPVSYEITFSLDTTSVADFSSFTVDIYLYRSGESSYSYYFYISKYLSSDSETVSAGTYDVKVKVGYQAITVTSDRIGTVKISVSYPG